MISTAWLSDRIEIRVTSSTLGKRPAHGSVDPAMRRAHAFGAYLCYCYENLQKTLNNIHVQRNPTGAKNLCIRMGRVLIALRWGVRFLSHQVVLNGRDEEEIGNMREEEAEEERHFIEKMYLNMERCKSSTKQLAMVIYFHYCALRLKLPHNVASVDDLDQVQRIKVGTKECIERFPCDNSIAGWEEWVEDSNDI